jgi:serine/threonine protein kinase
MGTTLQVSHALCYLERLELVHGDIKPANIGLNTSTLQHVLLDMDSLNRDGEETEDVKFPLFLVLLLIPPEFGTGKYLCKEQLARG